MRTSYDVAVAEPPDQLWASLTDVDSVLAALPGAALARDGDVVSGSLKCKLGPSQVTYRITVRAETGEAEFHNAVLAVTGKEARGGGTIAATLTVAARTEAAGSRIEVGAEIEATGRAENADEKAWRRVIEQLVNALAPQPAAAAPTTPPPPRPPLAVAPQPVTAPSSGSAPLPAIAVGVVALAMLLLFRRRRRHRRGR